VSGPIQIRRAKRGDLAAIAALVKEARPSHDQVDEAEAMDWLFSKGLLVAIQGEALVGVAGWQAENLVSVTDVFYVSPADLLADAGGELLASIEAEAGTLMCEANVLLMPQRNAGAVRGFLREQGYEAQAFQKLHRIWQEVLGEFAVDETELMVKQLRDRMVMVPI
jgi:N-acetylglutamate synthase-like GNAT family acetyltransferase